MELANILASIFSGIVALVMAFFCWIVYKLYDRLEKDISSISDKHIELVKDITKLTIRVETAYNMFEKEKDDIEKQTKTFKEEMRDIKNMLNIALLDKTQIQRQLDELWDRK